jgi:hypothetical protein
MYAAKQQRTPPMNTLRVALVAAAGMIATLGAVHAEIRVISPYGEHVYNSDPRSGAQLLDDEALQQRNARAETLRLQRQQQEDQRDLLRSEEVQD